MRTKEELDLFRMLASGNPYSDKLRAERYEALPHADVDGPEQLSEEHQRIFERYKDVLPNGTEFMGALARFPLGDSTMMFFIHVSELEGRFNPSLFIGLSPYFDQLTGEQLSPICEHLAKNSFDAQHVQTLVEILKLNTDEQMGSLINGGLDQEILQRRPDVLLNILKRVQAFIQTEGRLNMNNWNLSNNLFSYLLFSFHPAEIEEQTAKTLLVLQRFGFDDWQGLKQFIHYCPILEFEEDDLAAYGALEQYQKRVFSFLDSSISLADARRLLELAKTIVNEHEVEYLLYFTPRNRADVAGFLGGQVDTAQMAAKQGSVDAFCALSERTKQAYPTLFARMHEVSGGDTRHYSEASYRVLYALEYSRALSFVTGLQEAEIAQLAEALTVFRLPLAEEIFFELYNLINGVELIQFLYEKQGVLDRFSDDGPDTDKSLLRTFVRFTPTIQQMRDFFTSFEDYHPDFDIPDLKGVLMKESNCEDMLAALADYSSKAFEDELYEALSAFKKKHDENQGPYWSKQSVRRDRFIDTYFQELVYPEDLDDMDTLMKGLGDFLGRLEEAGYDPAIDPDRSRMLTFVNPERVLNSANNRFTHVAFILNFLRDSSPDTSSEKLMEWAKEHLDAEDEKIASKAAMLMVGMGTFVQDLDKDTLHKLCRVGVDEHLTQEVISGDITQAQSDYLAREESPRIPLNLYFSFLLILKKDGRSGDQTAFEALVEGYKAIENEPVFVGKVLVLAHDKFDSTHSFANGDDAFNPEALRILAEDVGGLECDILRHREDGESLESMLSTLQTTPGDLTACVGGHGNHDIISFGEEWFDMRQLFEVLAGRLEMQEEGEEPWVTQVLFTSCHSDYNSVLLNAMWERDQRTQGHPITFLSSSSEDSPSFKMAEDSWFVKAQQAAQEEGRGHLTWGEFFRDIESRTFIMSLIGEGYFGNKYRVNSNNNLYIDGKWRG